MHAFMIPHLTLWALMGLVLLLVMGQATASLTHPGPKKCLRLHCDNVVSTGPSCLDKRTFENRFFKKFFKTDGVNMDEDVPRRDPHDPTGQCTQIWSGDFHRTFKGLWDCINPDDICANVWSVDEALGHYDMMANGCSMPFDHGVAC